MWGVLIHNGTSVLIGLKKEVISFIAQDVITPANFCEDQLRVLVWRGVEFWLFLFYLKFMYCKQLRCKLVILSNLRKCLFTSDNYLISVPFFQPKLSSISRFNINSKQYCCTECAKLFVDGLLIDWWNFVMHSIGYIDVKDGAGCGVNVNTDCSALHYYELQFNWKYHFIKICKSTWKLNIHLNYSCLT